MRVLLIAAILSLAGCQTSVVSDDHDAVSVSAISAAAAGALAQERCAAYGRKARLIRFDRIYGLAGGVGYFACVE